MALSSVEIMRNPGSGILLPAGYPAGKLADTGTDATGCGRFHIHHFVSPEKTFTDSTETKHMVVLAHNQW